MERLVGLKRRGRPVVSGMLVLLLMAMMAAGAVVGRGPSLALAQEDGDSVSALTPETAFMYISMTLDTESEQWAQATDLMERLGLGGSIEEIFSDASASATGENVATVEDLQPFLGGDAAIVITSLAAAEGATGGLSDMVGGMPSASPEAPTADAAGGVAFIVSPSDPDAAFAKAEELTQEDADSRGETVVEEDYEGITIQSVPGDELTDEEGVAIARINDSIVVGPTVLDVQAIIDVDQGTVGALSDVPAFQQLTEALEPSNLIFGYVNGPALLDSVLTDDDLAELGMFGPAFTQQFEAYIGFVVLANDNGFRVDSLTVPAEGATLPAAPANFDPTLPDRLPADTALFIDSGDLGANPALDALALLVVQGMLGGESAATPAAGQSAEDYATQMFEQAAQLIGFNIQTDFIDQMVGEYGLAIWGLESMDPSQINALFVSGVSTPAVVNDALSKLSLLIQGMGQGAFAVTSRQVGSDQVSVLDLSETGTPLTVEYGVVGQEFVIGVNNGLTEYTTGATDALSSNATYQAAMDALPEEHNSVFFINLEQVIPLVEQTMTSMMGGMTTGDAAVGATPTDDIGVGGTAEPDFSKLTAFAAVSYQQDGMMGASAILLIAE